jgi:hypothetical protein
VVEDRLHEYTCMCQPWSPESTFLGVQSERASSGIGRNEFQPNTQQKSISTSRKWPLCVCLHSLWMHMRWVARGSVVKPSCGALIHPAD